MKIEELGGEVVSEEHMCAATHIVGSGLYCYSPTLLEALARGLWVVNIFYVIDSYEQLKWLDELQYEVKLETDVIGSAARRNRELALVRRCPNLSSWKIGLITDDDDPVSKSVFIRLLEAGGAKYFNVSKDTDSFTLTYYVEWVLVCGRSVRSKEIVNKLSEHGILCIRLGFLIDTLLMRCPQPMTVYIYHINDTRCHEQDTEFSLVMYGFSRKRKKTFLYQDNSKRKREKFRDKQRCRIYNGTSCETQDDFREFDDVPAIHSSIYECNSHLRYDASHSFLGDERSALQSVVAYPECGYMEEYYNQSGVESLINMTPNFHNNSSMVVKREFLDSLSQELGEMQHCELNLEETSSPDEIYDVDFSPVEDSSDETEISELYDYDKPAVSELNYECLDEVRGKQSLTKPPPGHSYTNITNTNDFITHEEVPMINASEKVKKEVNVCLELHIVSETKKNIVSPQEENTVLYPENKVDTISFPNELYATHFRPDTIKRHNPSTDEESGFHSFAEEDRFDDKVVEESVDGNHGRGQNETCCEVLNHISDVSQNLVGGGSCVSTYSEKNCSGNSQLKECQYTEVKLSRTNDANDRYCFYDCNKSESDMMDGDEMCHHQHVKLKVKKNSTPHWTRRRKLFKMTMQEILKVVKAQIEDDLDNPWLSLGVSGPPICCEGAAANVKMFSIPAYHILTSMLHKGLWFGALNFFDMAIDIGILPHAHAVQMLFDLILDTHDEDVLSSTRCSIDRLFRKYPPCSLHLNVYYKKVLASKPEDNFLHAGGMVATLLDLLEDELSDTSKNEQMSASNQKQKKHKYRDLPKSTRYQRIFMLLDLIVDALASDLGRWMQQHYLSVERTLWPERPLAESALRQWGTGIPTKSDIKLLFRVCLQLGDLGKLSYCESDSILRLMHIAAEVFRINEVNGKVEYPQFGAECEFFADQLFLQVEEFGLDSETSAQFLACVTPPWVSMLVGKKLIEKQLGESLRHPLLSVAAVLKERLKYTRERNDDKQNQKIVKQNLRKEDLTKDAYAGKNNLHSACAKGDVNAVHRILSTSCIDVNEYDSTGNTALYIAVQHGHKKCVTALLKFKPVNSNQCVNASIPGEDGGSPIVAAACSGRTDICHMLLEHSGPLLLERVTGHQLKAVLKSVPEDFRIVLQDAWKFYGHVVPPLCRPLSPDLWSFLSPVLPVITKSYLHAYNLIAVVCNYNVHRRVRRNSNPPTPRTIGHNTAHCYRVMSYQFCSLIKILRRIDKGGSINVDAYESIALLDAKLQ